MTYDFSVLAGTESAAALLRSEVAQAVAASGSWEGFIEVRMGAGPTVRINQLDQELDTFEVSVEWGAAQEGRSRVNGQQAAIEAADRIARAFYEIRDSSHVADA